MQRFHTFTSVVKKRNDSNAPMYAGTGNEGEIPMTTVGGLWGAYLMTTANFCKELAGSELAKLRAIRSVKLSSNLSSRRLKGVTV